MVVEILSKHKTLNLFVYNIVFGYMLAIYFNTSFNVVSIKCFQFRNTFKK